MIVPLFGTILRRHPGSTFLNGSSRGTEPPDLRRGEEVRPRPDRAEKGGDQRRPPRRRRRTRTRAGVVVQHADPTRKRRYTGHQDQEHRREPSTVSVPSSPAPSISEGMSTRQPASVASKRQATRPT